MSILSYLKSKQYLIGVLLIALLTATSLLALGSWLSSLERAKPGANASLTLLQVAGDFQADTGLIGEVELAWTATGTFSDSLTAPAQAELPDLGTIALNFLLEKEGDVAVKGYVELDTTYVFTAYHTISTTVDGAPIMVKVGPEVNGSYENGVLNLLSERFDYTTESGQAVERQFRLTGSPSQEAGKLTGEYRETLWRSGLAPVTIVGAFNLKDLKARTAVVNSAPVANPQVLNTTPNTPVAITLTGSDADNNALTFEIVTEPMNGLLSGDAPNLTYTPDSDYEGTDSFTFKVNDGTVDSETAAVTIDIAPPPNTPPVANAQTVEAVRGVAKTVTLTGTDADGNSLTFVVVTQPTNGTLTGTAPDLTYTSDNDFVGEDTFTFKVNDGTVDSGTVTVTINVAAPPNTAPVANAQTVDAVQGVAKAITLAGSDADGDTLTFTVVGQPTNGTLSGTGSPQGPNLIYTSNDDFAGEDTFTFKVNDGTVDSATATVTINVAAPPNTPPVANAQTVNAVQGQAKAITLTGSDADDDSLTFIVVAQPTNGSLTGSTPNLSYTSNADFAGEDSFTFKVNDGTADSSTVTVAVNVTAAPVENTPPVANAQSVNAVQGVAKAITLAGSDADGDTLTFTVVGQPTNGTLSGTGSPQGPNLIYTSNAAFTGEDTFTFKVNDGAVDSATATVTLNVTAAPVENTPPVANNQMLNAVQAQAKTITLSGSDDDGDTLAFTVVAQPANGTLSGDAPNLTYTSNTAFTGEDSFTFKVNDGKVDSATATVTLNVAAPPNTAPVANNQTINAVQGAAKSITLTGSDADDDTLTFTVVTQPANGILSGTGSPLGRDLTYTSNADFAGEDSFTFKVSDGTVDSAPATVTIHVTAPPNTRPVANAQTVNTVQSQAKAITLTGSDADDDTLTFTVLTQPSNGALSGTAPNLTYTSDDTFAGEDSFTFKVNDGTVDSPVATVTIHVAAPPNTAPVANAQSVNAVQGVAKTITLTGAEADDDTLTFTVVAQPTNGTLSGSAPNLTYTSDADFTGKDSFTFKVNDGTADSSTVAVIINVTAAPVENTAPVANAQTVNAVQGQAKAITLTGSDGDGDTLTFTIVTQPANGTLSGSAPNLTYTSNAGFTGEDSFTFNVNDGTTDSPTVMVTIVMESTEPTGEGDKVYLPMTKK